MARIGRFVVPDLPHHVTQRGNRRGAVFFGEEDYGLYHDLLREACAREGVAVWSYCLMPNHVHLILTPRTSEGLGRALGKAHRRYSSFINARLRVTGHLFQARFASVVMDEAHLMAAARYVALNPVRARLVERAQDWRWSSARAHLEGRDDGLVTVAPLLDRCAEPLRRHAGRRTGSGDADGAARGRNARPSARLARLPRPVGRADGPRSQAGQARAQKAGGGVTALHRVLRIAYCRKDASVTVIYVI